VEGGAADPGSLRERIDGDLSVGGGEVTGGGEDRRSGPCRAGVLSAVTRAGHLPMVAPTRSRGPVCLPRVVRQDEGMRSFLSGLSGHHQGRRPALLEELRGQTILHTRVAARGTWTVTARGWVLHSRIQQVEGPGRDGIAASAVGLRDPRLVGAALQGAELLPDGQLHLFLQGGAGPRRLSTVPRWQLEGPRGALLRAEERGEISQLPPGPPVHAAPEQLAEHAASARSGIEDRLLARGRDEWLHPGHVV